MAQDSYIRNRIAEEQQWWETSITFLVCILSVSGFKPFTPKEAKAKNSPKIPNFVS